MLLTIQRRSGLQSASDFTGYHKYATRRLHTLRKQKNLVTPPSKTMHRSELEIGHYELALLDAERNWAAAMAKRAMEDANSGKVPKLRQQIRSRFARAVKLAKLAQKLVPSDSPEKQLEACVYVELVAGQAALELQQFAKVLDAFAKVKFGAKALSNQDLDNLIQQVVDPALRLAIAQESGNGFGDLGETALEIVKDRFPEFYRLVEQVSPNVNTKETGVSEVRFRKHIAKVRYHNLSLLLKEALGANSLEDKIGCWQQCEIEVQALINELQAVGSSEQDLEIVSSYVLFNLLVSRIERDATEASSLPDPNNALRLFDVVLQSCKTLRELPGVFNDDELVYLIDVITKYYGFQRTLTVIKRHPKGSIEALALADLAHKRLNEYPRGENAVQTENAVAEAGLGRLGIASMESLVSKTLAKTYAEWKLYREVTNRSQARGSKSSDLSFWQEKPLVCDLQVQVIESCPVKPVFYDEAYNQLETNQLRTEMEVDSETDAKKKKFFGLF